MTFPLSKLFSLVAVLVAAGLLVAGCGDGDDETTATSENEAAETATTGGGGGGAGATVTIKMGDYYFSPESVTAKAGRTTIDAPNEGKVEHELVLFKSDDDAANLPTDAEGNVDEEALEEQGGEEAGEIEDVEPGESKSGEFNLEPGQYVMFCNIPGHYAQGMYGTVTVE